MWRSTVPTTGTHILDISTIFPENWDAIEQILGEEHYIFSNELSGRHISGKTAVLCSDALTGISGISGVTPPGSGAMGFDTTSGSLMAYLNSTWVWVVSFPQTAIKAYIGGGDQSIPPSGALVKFNTEINDDINEYNTATYTFTPAANGFFLIDARVSILTVGGVIVYTEVIHNDSSDNQKNSLISTYRTADSNRLSIANKTIIEAVAGDKIYVNITHNRIGNIIVEAGLDRSVLIIKRLS